MAAIIFLMFLATSIGFIYPAAALVYYKLIKHSSKSCKQILADI
jgi:hypothetical protein